MPLSLGCGINLRRSFLSEFSERVVRGDDTLLSRVDWVELVPENFMGRGGAIRRALSPVIERLPVSLHTVSLSIGSIDPLDWEFLSQLKDFVRNVGATWVTDHVSYSSVNGFRLHHLFPLPFTLKAARHVAERVIQIQDYLNVPFGLENPAYYKIMPGSEMSESEFISEILEMSDCSMLLDVNNVYVNCFNHSDHPFESARLYLRGIPLERVIEVHVAGHDKKESDGRITLLDTHGAPVSEPVRSLLEDLHQILSIKTLLLERENQVPPLNAVLEEISDLWKGLHGHPKEEGSQPATEAEL